MWSTVAVALVLLTGGTVYAFRLGSGRPPAPPGDWYADPASRLPRQRWWDGRTWTARIRPGDTPAARAKPLHGGFWGRWAWLLAAAVAILAAGSAAYLATGHLTVMAATSFAAMTLVCWAFYRFTARRLALDDTVAPTAVASVAAATIATTLLIAANLNSAVAEAGGITTATTTVGFIEEGTKLLVPTILFALGRFRDPRAGIALGLAAGFGFAIAETTQYAYQTAAASGPDLCGGTLTETSAAPTAASVIGAQVWRVFTVSPLHWLWSGIATAIVWRQWHLRGRRALPAAAGAVLAVMLLHSLNDTSATIGCDNPTVGLLTQLARWALLIAMYLIWRATARKSTPPQRIGTVSRGWHPKHLGG